MTSPLHDRIQLTAAELDAIAELECAASGPAAPEPSHEVVKQRRNGLRKSISFFEMLLPWFAPLGLVLVLLPLALAWRVVGLVGVMAGWGQLLIRATAHHRSRPRRTS